MIKIVIVALATLIPLAPVVMYLVSLRTKDPVKAAQKLVSGFKGYNVVLLLMGLGIAFVWLFSPQTVLAAGRHRPGMNPWREAWRIWQRLSRPVWQPSGQALL